MKRVRLVAKLIESRIATQVTRGYVVERVVMELCSDTEVISQWTTYRDHISTSLTREFGRHPYSDNLTVQFYDQAEVNASGKAVMKCTATKILVNH